MATSLLHDGDRKRAIPPLVGWSLAVALLTWIAFSFAGLPWIVIGPAAVALLMMGAFWLAAIIGSIRRPERHRAMLAAAAVLAAAVGGVALHLPTEARFALSEPSFATVVEQAGPPPVGETNDADPPKCPTHLGLYAISSCEYTPGGYLSFDPLGNALVDDAGFAYLPKGAHLNSNAGFELQELTHLQGNWYVFVASW